MVTKRHVIEILYTAKCKFLPLAVTRVRDAVAALGTESGVELRLTLVSSFDEALARRFRGSPTVRIDDRDVETRPGAVAPIGLMARGYIVDSKVERAPSVTAIRCALELASAQARARALRERGARVGAAVVEAAP